MGNRTNKRVLLDALKGIGRGLSSFGHNGPRASQQKLGSLEDANVYGSSQVQNALSGPFKSYQQQFASTTLSSNFINKTNTWTTTYATEPPELTKKELLFALEPYKEFTGDFTVCRFCRFFKSDSPSIVPEGVKGHAVDCKWVRDFQPIYIALKLELE